MAAAERSSEHPLGQAIVAGAPTGPSTFLEADSFDSDHRQGRRRHGRRPAACWSATGGSSPTTASTHRRSNRSPTELSGEGKTPMLVAVDGAPAGVVAVADTLKPDSAAAVAALQPPGSTS